MRFDDIYAQARKMDDPVARAKFLNRSILRRVEGFWVFHLLNIKEFWVQLFKKIFHGHLGKL